MDLRSLDRRIVTIFLIVFVQILGASLILPILPLYAQRQFNLSPLHIALLVSSFFAAQFLAGPYMGRLSDRHGRIPVLVASQIGTAISFAMLGFANSTWLLYAARIFDGITGGNIIVAQAYITDITPREERAQSLGYLMAAFGLGFIFGPALGGVLSAAYGPRVPFYMAAGAAAILVLMTWMILEETVTPEKQKSSRLQRGGEIGFLTVIGNFPLLQVLVLAFVGRFALGMLQSTFALFGDAVLFEGYSDEAATLGVGLLMAVIGMTQFGTQMFILRRLLARFSESALVILGTLIRAGGLLVFAVVTSPWLGALGSLLFALGMGVMMPPLQALATETVDDSQRGGVLGLFQSAQSLSTIASTAIGGMFFAIAPTMPYWFGVALTAVILPPAIALWRRQRSGTMQPQQEGPVTVTTGD